MKEAGLLSKVKQYCTGILENSKCSKLPFHNMEHTQEVVANTKKILAKMTVSPLETEMAIIAAWFHDIGFCEAYKGHEEISIKLACEFLEHEHYKTSDIQAITQCIQSTKLPQIPENEIAKVLCDADLFHVSTPNFFYRKQLLRKEWENEFNKFYTDMEWHQLNLEFLQNHQFLTEYGMAVLERGQQLNIRKVENLIKICG